MDVTIHEAAIRRGIPERELRRAVLSGRLPLAGRRNRAATISLEDLDSYQRARAADPPRKGRPAKRPGSLAEAAEKYRRDMQAFFVEDNRRRLTDLCRAYRAAEPVIAEIEEWVAEGHTGIRIASELEALGQALREEKMYWMSESSDADMSFVRIRRIAGWTWPAIAHALGKSESWVRIIDRRWQDTFGAVITKENERE